MHVPYQMVAAVDVRKRHAQMAVALHYADQYGYSRLQRVPIDDTKSITIAAYGPSLEQTYQTMTRPILSMSGATTWLAARGVIPDYHVDMDPRRHKVQFIDPPVPGVHYLMASVCHPKTWELLRGHRVTVWHTYSGKETYDWVEGIDAGENEVVRGGSTIGLTALHLAGLLGYRHLEIHGMDGSFNDATRSHRHAGPHPGTKQQDGITWDAGGRTYQTSKIMANAVTETLATVRHYPMFCVFHGDGLTQALIRERNLPNACCADETEKARIVRTARAHIVDVVPDTVAQWDRLYGGHYQEQLISDMAVLRSVNEDRRQHAHYNTGSVTVEQMAQLRALSLHLKPSTIIEVGTFIGNSTLALQADRIFTCDNRNDCFPATNQITTFPKTQSADMLRSLVGRGVKADLCFFDGRIKSDVPLIDAVSHDRTVFVCDDYSGRDKGVENVRALADHCGSRLTLIEPDRRLAGRSTLAALVPRSLVA